jgi:hypothetical protein
MTTSKRLAKLATLATVIIGSPGCDTLDPAGSGEPSGLSDVRFRDHLTGPGHLNTNFLGDEENYPLDNLPWMEDGEPGVELLEIRASKCKRANGMTISGEFSTLGLGVPVVPLSTTGVLGTLTLADVNDVTQTCTIFGGLWKNTFWEIRVEDGLDTIETDLWLGDLATAGTSMAYEWFVNYPRIDPEYAGEIEYHHTCDEDLDPNTDPDLAFHAYLMKDLRVDHHSGDFSVDPGTMFVACLKGAVGKAAYLGYAPWDQGTDMHNLGTSMVRADYCGDGTPHTAVGTEFWHTQNIFAQPPAGLVKEAEWSLLTGAATCVSTPRVPALYTGCSVPLPFCDGAAPLPVPSIVTFVEGAP